jgi:hypothetical protein
MLTKIAPLPLEVEVTMTVETEAGMYDASIGKSLWSGKFDPRGVK